MAVQSLILREQAIEIILESLQNINMRTEKIQTEQAFMRRLAEDIRSTEALPLADKATMDGYTLHAMTELPAGTLYKIEGEVFMGESSSFELKEGSCVSISTGGLLPNGANTVVKIEDTELIAKANGEQYIQLKAPVKPNQNLICRGEECHEGEILLKKETILTSSRMGLLALLGYKNVSVICKPKIVVITTGDELIPPFETIELGKVVDINGMMLKTLIEVSGGELLYHKRLLDDETLIETTLLQAVKDADLVITSGASSAGKKDCIPNLIEKHADTGLLFHGLNIKPGKPVGYGVKSNVPIVALPGNPVSTYMTYQWIVEPILKAFGALIKKDSFKDVILLETVSSSEGKETWFFAAYEPQENKMGVRVIHKKSGLISMIAQADGCFYVGPGKTLESGTVIQLMLL